MNRQEMIMRLLDATGAAARGRNNEQADAEGRAHLPVGLERLSARGLRREMQMRGLLDYEDPEPADDSDFATRSELMLLVSRVGSIQPSLRALD